MEGKKTKSEVTTLAQNPLLQSQEKDPRAVFTLREKLGEGSYGSVWRATYKQTGEDYAIKRVGIDNDLADLQVEITFMRSCDSEYIVRYFQSYVLGTELWIVMDYCCAGSVSDLMKATDTTLNVPQMQLVTRCALRGLEYLHAMHKIHRDIKCGNILLNAHGIGKLADFGVSGQLCDTMAKRHTFIGSPFWMAPEVIQEVGYNEKADIWSLGITVIEMAEGRPPNANIHPMRAIFMIPSRPPPRLTDEGRWPRELCDFLALCVTKDPAARPSAAQLLEHPFIKSCPATYDSLLELMKRQEDVIKEVGREKALGLDGEEDTGEECQATRRLQRGSNRTGLSTGSSCTPTGTVVVNSGTGTGGSGDDTDGFDDGTMVRHDTGSENSDTDGFDDGTMVRHDTGSDNSDADGFDDGTMVVYDSSDTEEPVVTEEDRAWLRRLEETRAARRRAAAAAETENNPYKDLSDEQLAKMLQDLDKERNELMNKVLNEARRSREQICRMLEQVRARSKQ